MAAIIWLLIILGLVFINSKSKFVSKNNLANGENNIINSQYLDKSLFLSALKQNQDVIEVTSTITGIIVPHHLLAKDLIASTFACIKAQKYQQIILLSPNHFEVGTTSISVTTKNFNTVFGVLKTDVQTVEQVKQLPFVGEADFFYREHGLQAQLPFIKYYFPEVQVVAVAFKSSVTKSELDSFIQILKTQLKPNALIIQSTDFSHYLTRLEAQKRDQESLFVIESLASNQILALKQPENIDSLASQYVQNKLQKEFFNSQSIILTNKNSQDYTAQKVTSTTSYITALYRQIVN